MPTLTKFNDFPYQLGRSKHNLETDELKVALTNTTPLATNTVLGEITEIAGGSYPVGGYALDNAANRLSANSGTAILTLADQVITAGVGGIPTFRYLVVYNNTQTDPLKPLVGWYDYGQALTLSEGESLTLDFADTAGGGTLNIA